MLALPFQGSVLSTLRGSQGKKLSPYPQVVPSLQGKPHKRKTGFQRSDRHPKKAEK